MVIAVSVVVEEPVSPKDAVWNMELLLHGFISGARWHDAAARLASPDLERLDCRQTDDDDVTDRHRRHAWLSNNGDVVYDNDDVTLSGQRITKRSR